MDKNRFGLFGESSRLSGADVGCSRRGGRGGGGGVKYGAQMERRGGLYKRDAGERGGGVGGEESREVV